ncbi:ABC transporter permease [Alicyclobacillus mengziensis]|uniref:ABC transporter permease n=1 Tax=Alicyclobacillus mengziensis TaxID=2931921 RepID=A0A9X7Z761_9BACL|nr:ABC transporter permease [Alicyclobacillus mengziensis]QSO47101.1 ABC transporter permease [Alicyclobacillus mengziensis]
MALATEPGTSSVVSQGRPKQPGLVRRIFRKKVTIVAVGFLVVVALAAIFAPFIAPYKLNQPDLNAMLAPPSATHFMGTDDVGIDLFTEVLYGGRVSLAVGLISAVVAVGIGGLIGSLAGFFGGWVDEILMRLTDVGLSVPSLFIILGLTAVLGASPVTIVEVISLTSWMYPARLIRSRILQLRSTDYVMAARMIGAGSGRIIFLHIIPNAISPLIVNATLLVGQAIVLESVMSFLGAGIQPPHISWGFLLNQAQSYVTNAPWLAVFPGLMIFLVVLSFNVFGDAIRDALDARNN